MTVGEVSRAISSFERVEKYKQKKQAMFDYTLANLVRITIGQLNSNSISYPSIYNAYPSLFDGKAIEEQQQEQRMKDSINRFMAFKEKNNAKYKKEVEKNK